MSEELKIGDRVRFSEQWVRGSEIRRLRRGEMIGESRDRVCWNVLLDGTKTPSPYHKSFIEKIPAAES